MTFGIPRGGRISWPVGEPSRLRCGRVATDAEIDEMVRESTGYRAHPNCDCRACVAWRRYHSPGNSAPTEEIP